MLAAHRLRRCVANGLLTFTFLLPGALRAQAPAGWDWKLDRPATLSSTLGVGAGSWVVSEMVPGMHVTTGPGILLYRAGETLSDRFAVEGEFFFFPDSKAEGHGVFVGGRELGTPSENWLGFLVGGNGKFAVVQRAGGATKTLIEWADAAPINRRGTDKANRVRISAEPDSIRLLVNDERVAALPRAGLDVNGIYGIRVEPDVNLHVTNLDATRRYLRARGQK